MTIRKQILCVALLMLAGTAAQATEVFNGGPEYQEDWLGYYYAMTGGKDPDGPGAGTIGPDGINGDNASGGTFRFITDDPAWGYTTDTWHRDDWFPQNMSLAMTFQYGGGTVYDNNGLEDGSFGNYYDATAQGLPSASTPGLYRGYAMSNNYDWVYAGEFIVPEGQTLTIDTLIGYFDPNSGFDPNDPNVAYRMNIWSSVQTYQPGVNGVAYDPVNTGSFIGDVFSSDTTTGAFAWADTGYDRVFGTDYGSMTDEIWRLVYTLNDPIVLTEGVYFFSHDATVPEPVTLLMLGGLGAGMAAARRLRRRKA